MTKHYKAGFKGNKSAEDSDAVGKDGTQVYFSGGKGHGKNPGALGVSGEPGEASESEARKHG